MPRRTEYRSTLLVVFLASLAFFTSLAYVMTTPHSGEEFLQLYVLGPDRNPGRLYPRDDPNIPPNASVHWYVGITNSMATVQYVMARFKLGNMSIPPPNGTLGSPSPAPILAEYSMVLLENQTWEFPFSWKIVAANSNGETVSLTLNVNGTLVAMRDPLTIGGRNFRIIIELWIYNPENGALEFGWLTNSQRRVAWLQVWFNVAPRT